MEQSQNSGHVGFLFRVFCGQAEHWNLLCPVITYHEWSYEFQVNNRKSGFPIQSAKEKPVTQYT